MTTQSPFSPQEVVHLIRRNTNLDGLSKVLKHLPIDWAAVLKAHSCAKLVNTTPSLSMFFIESDIKEVSALEVVKSFPRYHGYYVYNTTDSRVGEFLTRLAHELAPLQNSASWKTTLSHVERLLSVVSHVPWNPNLAQGYASLAQVAGEKVFGGVNIDHLLSWKNISPLPPLLEARTQSHVEETQIDALRYHLHYNQPLSKEMRQSLTSTPLPESRWKIISSNFGSEFAKLKKIFGVLPPEFSPEGRQVGFVDTKYQKEFVTYLSPIERKRAGEIFFQKSLLVSTKKDDALAMLELAKKENLTLPLISSLDATDFLPDAWGGILRKRITKHHIKTIKKWDEAGLLPAPTKGVINALCSMHGVPDLCVGAKYPKFSAEFKRYADEDERELMTIFERKVLKESTAKKGGVGEEVRARKM